MKLRLLALAMLSMVACVTTKVTSSWKDPGFAPRDLRKVLVIGMAEKVSVQRLFEDEFGARFKEKKIDAVPGYSVLPSPAKWSKEQLAGVVQEIGADAVLVSRLADVKNLEQHVPASTTMVPRSTTDLYGYYAVTYDYVYNPGYTIEKKVLVIETNLYDAASGKLLWTGLSDTVVDAEEHSLVISFVNALAGRLFESR